MYPHYNRYMPKARKKPVIETHGKVEDKFEPTLLEQVWGRADISRYGTLVEEDYTKRIHNMTRADLEAHARQMGIVIVENTMRLRDKLLSEFRQYAASITKPLQAPRPITSISEQAMKVLAEGR